MNLKNTLAVAFLLAFFSPVCRAQSNAGWQPLAFISGTSSYKGVQAYSQTTVCNGTSVVFIKFVNTNNYAIKAGWKNMMVTQANEQVNSPHLQDSVTIAAHAQVAGNCSTGNLLTLKFSDFGINPADLKYVVAIDFGFVKTP